MVEVTDEPFELGQLILDRDFNGRPVLWSVARVAKSGKATLVAHHEAFSAEVTTSVKARPVNWELISQERAVQALTREDK
jgi:hypothetical protein